MREIARRLPWLAIALAAGVWLTDLLQAHADTAAWIRTCCSISTSDTPLTSVLRWPGSVLAPAPDLPCWGAIAQVLVVVGIAEAWFGWRRTLVVGAVAHGCATLTGEAAYRFSWLLHQEAPNAVRDTGPSVFVIAVMWWAAWKRPSRLLRGVVLVVTAVIVMGGSNLAALEHLVAALVGWFTAETSQLPRPRLQVASARIRDRIRRRWQVWRHWSTRHAAVTGVGVLLVVASWHAYHPLSADAAPDISTPIPSAHLQMWRVRVENHSFLPVRIPPLHDPGGAEINGWWSSARSCSHHFSMRARWVWLNDLWWCQPLPLHAGIDVKYRYRVVGVPQTARVTDAATARRDRPDRDPR